MTRLTFYFKCIHEKKGVHNLIEAYSTLLDQNAMSSAFPKLVIAGPGLDSGYGKKLQEMVSASKATVLSVYFPGMLTGSQKWGAFINAKHLYYQVIRKILELQWSKLSPAASLF